MRFIEGLFGCACVALALGACATSAPPQGRGGGGMFRAIGMDDSPRVAPASTPALPSGTRRALIIAVGDYPDETGWSDLASVRDARALKRALRRRGFERSDIEILRDRKASAKGIRSALRALLERTGEGDLVFLHYSGHGHQITDEDAPPEEPDGYDEVLVPYGAPMIPQPGYDGSLHIRDDELGEWLSRLRERVGEGGAVVMTVDSCHSGTITRASVATRGATHGPIGAPAKGAPEGGDSGIDASDGAGSLVVLSAARSDQTAMEVVASDGSPLGSLTWSFVRALERASPGETFEGVFAQMRADLLERVPGQEPQLFGDANTIFMGVERGLDAPFSVVSIKGDVVELDGGSLAGLGEGARVDFVRDGEVVASGDVDEAGALSSLVRIEGAARLELDRSSARLARAGFGDLRLPVLASADPGVSEALAQMPFVRVVDAGEQVRVHVEDGRASAVTANGAIVWSGEAADAVGLRGALERAARRAAIAQVRLDDTSIDLDVRVRAATHTWRDGTCEGSVPGDGVTEIGVGGEYVLEVATNSEDPLYLTVLVLGADGGMVQLYPPPGSTREGGLLPSGERTYVVPRCMSGAEPAGVDQFKVFVTRAPVDFSPAIDGVNTRAAQRDPLSALVSGVLSGEGLTRGASEAGAGRTASVSIRTVGVDP